MSAYIKINDELVPVTTEGHPQYYFTTQAQAEAALSQLPEGSDVFVKEGSNEDLLPRVEELEDDVVQINNNLSWKSLTHSTATVTQIDETTNTIVVSNNANIQNANEVIIPFTQNRIGQITLTRTQNNNAIGLSTYISGAYSISVKAYCDFNSGTIGMGCSMNSWGLSTIPVSVSANSVVYR